MFGERATGGFTASTGSRVMPTLAATICRSVSRLVARNPDLLVRAGQAAHVQRLVAQAVAVLQQQQVLVGQFVQVSDSRLASGWCSGTASRKGSSNSEFAVQLVVVHRQREQAGIEPALAQARQQHVALLLHQQQFQLREARADAAAPRAAAGRGPASGTCPAAPCRLPDPGCGARPPSSARLRRRSGARARRHRGRRGSASPCAARARPATRPARPPAS